MTNKRIIWKMPDGSIVVTTPAPKCKRSFEEIAEKSKPEGAIRMPDCNVEDLPSREFRHKWRSDSKGKIIIDNTVADLPLENK